MYICKILLFILLTFSFVQKSNAESVSGKFFKLEQTDGDTYLYNFKNDGTCNVAYLKSHSGNEGKIFNDCTWKQNKNLIQFGINTFYSLHIGLLNNGIISGHFYSNHKGGSVDVFQARNIQ